MELGDASPSKSRDVAEPSAPPKNGATNDSASKTMSTVTRNGTEEVQSDTVTIPADPLQILIKTFPPNLPREKLENVFRTQPGFRYLALGEPNPAKKMHRIGWAEFEEGTDMAAALEALDKQVVSVKCICDELDRHALMLLKW